MDKYSGPRWHFSKKYSEQVFLGKSKQFVPCRTLVDGGDEAIIELKHKIKGYKSYHADISLSTKTIFYL